MGRLPSVLAAKRPTSAKGLPFSSSRVGRKGRCVTHSITSSASSSNASGIVSPMATAGPLARLRRIIRSNVLLRWFAFEVGGIGKGIGATIHPHHPGLFRSLRAPGVRREWWNDDCVVRANDTAFFAELHPDPTFKQYDGFFHFVHMERHCSARLSPVHEQANPACAEVLVREKSSVDTGPHQNFRNRAPIDERHEIIPPVRSENLASPKLERESVEPTGRPQG